VNRFYSSCPGLPNSQKDAITNFLNSHYIQEQTTLSPYHVWNIVDSIQWMLNSFFFLVVLEFELSALLYHLSHTLRPLVYLSNRVCFCLGLALNYNPSTSTSHIDGIIEMHCHAWLTSFLPGLSAILLTLPPQVAGVTAVRCHTWS
jgi:hypothetical protein